MLALWRVQRIFHYLCPKRNDDARVKTRKWSEKEDGKRGLTHFLKELEAFLLLDAMFIMVFILRRWTKLPQKSFVNLSRKFCFLNEVKSRLASGQGNRVQGNRVQSNDNFIQILKSIFFPLLFLRGEASWGGRYICTKKSLLAQDNRTEEAKWSIDKKTLPEEGWPRRI